MTLVHLLDHWVVVPALLCLASLSVAWHLSVLLRTVTSMVVWVWHKCMERPSPLSSSLYEMQFGDECESDEELHGHGADEDNEEADGVEKDGSWECESTTVVIGAGCAGCMAVWSLARYNAEQRHRRRRIVLIEKEAFIGGRTRSERTAHGVIDTGAAFLASFYTLTLECTGMIEQAKGMASPMTFPLQPRVTIAQRSREHDGTTSRVLDASSIWSIMATGSRACEGVGVVALARRALLDMLRWGASLHIADPYLMAAVDDECGEAFAERIGSQGVAGLFRLAIESFWYYPLRDCSEALLRTLLCHAATMPTFYRVHEGMDQICLGILERAKVLADVQVLTSTEAAALCARADGQYEVMVRHADGATESIAAHEVVLATTASASHRLLSTLPTHAASDPLIMRFLEEQQYAATIHVCVLVAHGDLQGVHWKTSVGVFHLLPDGQEREVAAIGIVRQMSDRAVQEEIPDGRALLSLYAMDAFARKVLARWGELSGPESFEQYCARELWTAARRVSRELPGWSSLEQREVVMLKVHDEAIPIAPPTAYQRSTDVLKKQRVDGGRIVLAGDYLASATVEGALRTGLWAAEALRLHDADEQEEAGSDSE